MILLLYEIKLSIDRVIKGSYLVNLLPLKCVNFVYKAS